RFIHVHQFEQLRQGSISLQKARTRLWVPKGAAVPDAARGGWPATAHPAPTPCKFSGRARNSWLFGPRHLERASLATRHHCLEFSNFFRRHVSPTAERKPQGLFRFED